MGDFNEVCGDNPKMMATIISAGKLTDVHAHKHGHANIAAYIRKQRRVDYFVCVTETIRSRHMMWI